MSTQTNLWEQFEQAAALARQIGNLLKASRVLKESFREAEEYGEIPPSLVEAAYSLAEDYLKQGRFAEAESLYRAVLELREKLLGPTHEDVVDSLKKVALVQILAFRAEALGRKVVAGPLQWGGDMLPAAM